MLQHWQYCFDNDVAGFHRGTEPERRVFFTSGSAEEEVHFAADHSATLPADLSRVQEQPPCCYATVTSVAAVGCYTGDSRGKHNCTNFHTLLMSSRCKHLHYIFAVGLSIQVLWDVVMQ